MFIAQACDIHLSWTQVGAMLGLMLLTSKGVAGVTGSGFVALVATLTVMPDLPVAGVALIIGIDRFMSEARALTSTMSNAVASVRAYNTIILSQSCGGERRYPARWKHAVDSD